MQPAARSRFPFTTTRFGVLLAVLLAVLIAQGIRYAALSSPLPFDSHTWKTDRRVRRRMVRDLIDSRRLIGLTEPQVEMLLGPPNSTWHNPLAQDFELDFLVSASWRWRTRTLEVRFEAGRAVSAEY